ncbi:MAG: lipopolysaccharide biosynthesis protein [Pseudomonadota bacterium]
MKIPTLTIVKSVAWNSVGNMVGIICTLASLMIMSRLLTPSDFGLFGIAMVVLLMTEGFCYGEAQDSLIQHENTTSKHINTLHSASTIISVSVFASLFFLAPSLAAIFDQPDLVPIIRAIGFILLVGPLSATSAALLIRELEFKKITAVDIAGTVIPAIIGVTLAFYLRSAWALVWLELSRRIIRCLMFTWLARYRPRYEFDWPSLKELFSFAGYSTLLGFAVAVQRATPGAIIGWAMGTAPLGLFNMALRFFEQARQALITPFAAVAFPVFSKAQATREELHRVIKDSSTISMYLILPAFLGALVLAPLLVPLLFGDQWIGAVQTTQLALLLGPLTMIEDINNNLLKGIGRPVLVARITIISTLFTATGVFLVSGFTIEAVMCVLIAQKILALTLATIMAKQFAGYSFSDQFLPLRLPALSAISMAAIVWAAKSALPAHFPAILQVGILVPVGVIAYLALVRILAPDVPRAAIDLLKGARSAS